MSTSTRRLILFLAATGLVAVALHLFLSRDRTSFEAHPVVGELAGAVLNNTPSTIQNQLGVEANRVLPEIIAQIRRHPQGPPASYEFKESAMATEADGITIQFRNRKGEIIAGVTCGMARQPSGRWTVETLSHEIIRLR